MRHYSLQQPAQRCPAQAQLKFARRVAQKCDRFGVSRRELCRCLEKKSFGQTCIRLRVLANARTAYQGECAACQYCIPEHDSTRTPVGCTLIFVHFADGATVAGAVCEHEGHKGQQRRWQGRQQPAQPQPQPPPPQANDGVWERPPHGGIAEVVESNRGGLQLTFLGTASDHCPTR